MAFASTADRSRNAGSRDSALRTFPSAPSISSSCAPSCAASPGRRARITTPSWGWHYGTFFKQLQSKPAVSAADLTAAALLYDDIYAGSGQTPVERALVHEPVTPAYDRLRFTNRDDMAVLPPVLDMMEFVVDELRAARISSAGYAEPAALEAPTLARAPARAAGTPLAAHARADESRSLRHRFQSFWHGGALSPYEHFCLKSFVDCGYAVDLYS